MKDCNPVSTPVAPDEQLKKNLNAVGHFREAHRAPYRHLVGSLLYAAMGTRPELAYIDNQLSQLLGSPCSSALVVCEES